MKQLHFNENHFTLLSKILAETQPALDQYKDEEVWGIASETWDNFVDAINAMLLEHGDNFDEDKFRDSVVDNFLYK